MRKTVLSCGFGRRPINGLVAGLLLVAVGACAPAVSNVGNLPDPDTLSRIQPGLQTRNDVANLLGSPSSVSKFGSETWLYISRRTEKLAFFEPDVVEQQVVAISFNDLGVVNGVEAYGLDDARDVEVVERETPALGGEPNLIQSLYNTLLAGPGSILGGAPAENEGFVR